LRTSLIFSNLVVIKQLNSNHPRHNLYANFVKILDVCKIFSANLVNELGNMPWPCVVPKFSDLEVIALKSNGGEASSSSTHIISTQSITDPSAGSSMARLIPPTGLSI